MGVDQAIPLIGPILSGGVIGAVLAFVSASRKNESEYAIKNQQYVDDITRRLQENLVAEIDRMQKEIDRLRLEVESKHREICRLMKNNNQV